MATNTALKPAPMEEQFVDLMIQAYGDILETAKKDMPNRLRATMGADKNQDGIIDSK